MVFRSPGFYKTSAIFDTFIITMMHFAKINMTSLGEATIVAFLHLQASSYKSIDTYIFTLPALSILHILNSISAMPPMGIRSLPVTKSNVFFLSSVEKANTISQKYLENIHDYNNMILNKVN